MNPLAIDLRSALDPAILFGRAFGMAPMPHQVSYLRSTRSMLVVKGRQTGFSTSAAGKAIHRCWYEPNVTAAIVSPSLKQSTAVASIARRGLRALGARLEADSASRIRLANGSAILCLPGTAKSVRGFTAALLIADEAAYLEEPTWVAARPLIATGGQLIVQSTPAAARGFFFELSNAADPAWQRITVRSDEVPTISAEFLAAEQRAMAAPAFRAEYLCEFGQVGASLFTAERLASFVLPAKEMS